MFKMMVLICVCVLSLLTLSMATPLEDDLRALKAEIEELKTKTEQNVQSLKQDLMFVQTEVTNLTSISNSSRQYNVKTMTELWLLKNLTSVSRMETENKLHQLERRISQVNKTISSMKGKEAALKTQLSSHIQDYAALKNTLNAVKQNVHSTIAFKAEGTIKSLRGIMKFNSLLINIGNAYDLASGRFTTPTTGYYRFTLIKNQHIDTYIVINGKKQPLRLTGFFLELNKSDIVWFEVNNPGAFVNSISASLHGYLISTN